MATSMGIRNISESARERETFRHDPTLLSDIRYHGAVEPTSHLEVSTSADPILTALAQLGACRTGGSRAFISLFDQAHQYIIAEATTASSLRANTGSYGTPHERFWLQGTAISRDKGICQQFLNVIKPDENDSDADLPVNIIPDIRADPQLSNESCVLLGSPARGYVGVPIRSRNGVDFGEYSIVTEQPIRKCDWKDADSRLLREISQSILDHLLSKASQFESERAEKKTHGIGSFVEQRLTSMGSQQVSAHDTNHENPLREDIINNRNRGSFSGERGSLGSMRSRSLSGSIVDSHRKPVRPAQVRSAENSRVNRDGFFNVNSPQTTERLRRNSTSAEEDPLTNVFSKAASIIRESIDAEGVVFFDASARSFASFGSQYTGSEESQSNTSEEESGDSDNVSTESSSMHNDANVIASSTLESPSVDKETQPSTRKRISFKALLALLRRYPRGAIFDFDENGKLQPSSGDQNTQSYAATTSGSPKLSRKRTRSFVGNLGTEVSKAFSGARSVAFVPVWDQVRKRWRAGCFAYTIDKTRFFTTQCDISYLFAFATLAMAEIASLETHLASQAQSDVLGSLSHELRSPLHGIILGVEFLSDTSLSVFQGNLLHILETCGRTLSDTIDHLLYYAKVNNFIPPGKTPDSRARGLRKEMNCTLQAGMKSITAPVRFDVLVEEVTESIFAGFNFQRLSIGQLERGHRKSHADTYAIRRSDNFQATEDLEHWLEEGGDSSGSSKHIVVDLAIDPSCSHYYHAISGAIRRILMNLFGNALKFTSSGSIRIALSQEFINTRKSRNNNTRWVKLVVTDTGKGIAEDFLSNHVFQEFHQENTIGPGLGLGLCVVKKIVSSLRGKVSIESKVGVGTTATVLLPLQPIHPSNLPESSGVELDEYAKQKRQLKGLRVCFVGFNVPLGLPNLKGQPDDYPSIWNICRKDLAMEIVLTTQAATLAPDIVLCEESALYDSFVARDILSRTPLVVVCANALSAYRLSVDARFHDCSTITEFISQPTGPRKLAKVLMAALQRWVERQDQSESADNMAPLSLRRVSSRSHNGLDAPNYGKEMFNILNMTGSGPFDTSAVDRPRRPRSPSISPCSSPQPATRARSASPERPEPQKFLLVEDNAINMRILCAYMKKLGRSYVTAQDGQVAVEKYLAKPGHFNCLLMDINMPRLDGLQATRKIREFEAANHLEPSAVIALSGLASETVQQEALESGVDLFLTKPVMLQEISQILKSRGLM
ncbi:hypothetical protein F5Y12DRAFT_797638 [Xylaria sp. FL1777]|nr:hypothetical protein F5Y12DRAFT_797638 [Xylaria sp. FL1777]